MYTMTREERRAHKFALDTLVEIHLDTRAASDKPSDTAALLIDRIGSTDAAEAVALAIACKGGWDGRISDRNRRWAEEVLPLGEDICKDAGIYYPSEIHPAHLDMIADAMRKMTSQN